MSVAYPAGRSLAAERDDQPLLDPAAAARRRRGLERVRRGAARPIMSVAAAARSRLAPASWYIDSARPEVGERVERRDRPRRSPPAGRAARPDRQAGWPGRYRDRRRPRRPGSSISACASFQPSATERSAAGLRRVVDRVDLQRVLAAQLEDDPVDLDAAGPRSVVDAALQLVAEQRPELLAVAHAVARGSAPGGRRSTPGRWRTARVAPPAARRGRATRRAGRRRCSRAAATAPARSRRRRGSVTVPSGTASDAGHRGYVAPLDAAARPPTRRPGSRGFVACMPASRAVASEVIHAS